MEWRDSMLNFIKTDIGEISISYENNPILALNSGISDKCIPYTRAERDIDKTVYGVVHYLAFVVGRHVLFIIREESTQPTAI